MIQQSLFDRLEKPSSNDHRRAKKPALEMDTPDHVIRKYYGKNFLYGWLKVKNSVRF